MLTKSKRNAVVMALAFVVSRLTVGMLLACVPYLLTGKAEAALLLFGDKPITPTALAIVFLIMLFGVAAFAFLIYTRFGEDHFGIDGMIRWIIFGGVYALSLQLYQWLLPSFMQENIIRPFFHAMLLYPSHWLAFRSTYDGKAESKPEDTGDQAAIE